MKCNCITKWCTPRIQLLIIIIILLLCIYFLMDFHPSEKQPWPYMGVCVPYSIIEYKYTNMYQYEMCPVLQDCCKLPNFLIFILNSLWSREREKTYIFHMRVWLFCSDEHLSVVFFVSSLPQISESVICDLTMPIWNCWGIIIYSYHIFRQSPAEEKKCDKNALAIARLLRMRSEELRNEKTATAMATKRTLWSNRISEDARTGTRIIMP